MFFSLQEPIFLKGWWGSVLHRDFPRFAYDLEPPRANLFETFAGGLFYDGMRGVCHLLCDTPRKAYVSLPIFGSKILLKSGLRRPIFVSEKGKIGQDYNPRPSVTAAKVLKK
jgi:hypothetical protein